MELAAKRLEGTSIGRRGKIAQVNCRNSNSKRTCYEHEIKSYDSCPIFDFSPDSSPKQHYERSFSEESIISHVVERTLKGIAYLRTPKEIEEFKYGDRLMKYKLIIKTRMDSSLAETAMDLLRMTYHRLASIAVDLTGSQDTETEQHAKRTDSVTLYNTVDNSEIELQGDHSLHSISAFILDNYFSGIAQLDSDTPSYAMERHLPLVWIFIDPNDVSQLKLIESLQPIAKQYNDKFTFGQFDIAHWPYTDLGAPTFVPDIIVEFRPYRGDLTSTNYRYPPGSQFTPDDFKALLDNAISQSLPPFIKSEPIPEAPTHALKVVVLDPHKDALVHFYPLLVGDHRIQKNRGSTKESAHQEL